MCGARLRSEHPKFFPPTLSRASQKRERQQGWPAHPPASPGCCLVFAHLPVRRLYFPGAKANCCAVLPSLFYQVNTDRHILPVFQPPHKPISQMLVLATDCRASADKSQSRPRLVSGEKAKRSLSGYLSDPY